MSLCVLFILMITLLAGFVLPPSYSQKARAAELKEHVNCEHSMFHRGDTLITSAVKDAEGRQVGKYVPSIIVSGYVRWYAYNSLEQSTYQQVNTLLRRAAARYGVPAQLILAIARQESGLRQHVIARDGGIGVMQIMPDTAMAINKMAGGAARNPYKLQDNIFMGAFYLRTLGNSFHWNMPQVISAYNEGPWAVKHQGIFNWHYVNNVMAMVRSAR